MSRSSRRHFLLPVLLLASCTVAERAPEAREVAAVPQAQPPRTAGAPAQPAAAAGPAPSARPSGPIYVPELVAHGMREPQAYALLSELCSVAPLRLSGSPGAERAVEWGRATMERLGLENVRLEPVMVPRWERGERAELH